MPNDVAVIEGREIATVENATLGILAKSEIDQQIATAHRYPRSVSGFRKEMLQMVTLSEKIASECIYALPRDGKTIEGPSARFAEIAASAWGNARAGARVVNEGDDFVTAQGVFHDLERNVAITYEVQRRITDSKGRRYKPDMIGVTANAACSIALRNAILKGIPKAFWSEMYDAARHAAVGDVKSLADKRAGAMKAFAAYNVSEAQILGRLGREGIQDVTIDDLVALAGFLTAIKEGEATPESIFEPASTAAAPVSTIGAAKERLRAMAPQAKAAEPSQGETTNGVRQMTLTYADVAAAIKGANSIEDCDAVADLLRGIENQQQYAELDVELRAKRKALS